MSIEAARVWRTYNALVAESLAGTALMGNKSDSGGHIRHTGSTRYQWKLARPGRLRFTNYLDFLLAFLGTGFTASFNAFAARNTGALVAGILILALV